MPVRTCSYCDSQFSKIEHLKRHERSHTGEKPFECKRCHKRFSRGDVLSRHLKGHNGQEKRRKSSPEPFLSAPPRFQSPRAALGDSPAGTTSSSSPAEGLNPTGSTPEVSGPSPSTGSLRNVMADPPTDLDMLLQTVDSHGSLSSRVLESPSELHFASPHPRLTTNTIPEDDDIRQLFTMPLTMDTVPENVVTDDELLCSFSDQTMTGIVSDPAHQHPHIASASGDRVSSFRGRLDSRSTFEPDSFPEELSRFLEQQHSSGTWPSTQGANDEHYWLEGLEGAANMSNMHAHHWAFATSSLSHPSSFGSRLFRLDRRAPLGADIPNERFAKVAKLWTRKGERPWQLIQTLWSDVVDCPGSNIFSMSNGTDSSDTRIGSLGRVDDAKRRSLIREYGVGAASMNRTPEGIDFPSTDLIEICTDIYFHRFHPLMPMIHRPTFSPSDAPNMILFPVCLIGLLLLDPKRTRRFVLMHLSDAMEKCNASLSRPWARSDSVGLLITLASSVLLVTCAATLEELVGSDLTHALYHKSVSVAQQNSLFEIDKGVPLSSLLPQRRYDNTAWKAWARAESANRIISCMIMIDSFFASNLGISPIIRVDTMKLYAPCSTALFAAPDAARWSQLDSAKLAMNPPVIDGRTQACIPTGLGSSSLGLYVMLSCIWLRLADVRHRIMLLDGPSLSVKSLIPGELYQKDASGAAIVPMLQQLYATYAGDLGFSRPNHMIFWHNIHIAITADIDSFEVGAGREGRESALVALDNIAKWAETPAARRACLHAAQSYLCMSNRKVSDGTSFLSEAALFNAALVLGLYMYISPSSLQERPTLPDAKPFELLDDVDWGKLGDEGLSRCNVSRPAADTAAAQFIRNGGIVSFAGVCHSGGFGSLRKIILEYVGLLEEVGKWKVDEFCRILRALSDSPADIEA